MAYQQVIGLGVAGNFAGHLEQAGEARDFVAVKVKDAIAPKAIFPFYLPGVADHFLGTYPLSHDTSAIRKAPIICRSSLRSACCVISSMTPHSA